MKKCLVTIAMVGSLLGLGACKKEKGGAADMTGKMTEFKDAMCKCKPGDSACANKVVEDQKKWTEEWAKTAGKNAAADSKAAAEMATKMEPITAAYGKCMTAAMTPVAGAAPADPGAAPAAPAGGTAGCGADWANPLKTYCVTLPAGYTAGAATSTENFTAEKIKFTGPDGSFEIYDDKGDTYDKTLASHEKEVKENPIKESGATPGTGQWWYYTESEYPRMMSLVKASSGEPIWCHASGKPDDEGDAMPAAPMAACKSLRAYPQ